MLAALVNLLKILYMGWKFIPFCLLTKICTFWQFLKNSQISVSASAKKSKERERQDFLNKIEREPKNIQFAIL